MRKTVICALVMGLLGGLLSQMVWSWTYTYNTATPAGSDVPWIIDDRIREVKDAIQERENVDHFWSLTTTQVSDPNTGKHRQVTFKAAISTPTLLYSPEAAIYSKTVSGRPELFYVSYKDANEVQITSNHKIASTLASGSVDQNEILLDNNSYLLAKNAAGTSHVNLIKADANDVAVLPDGAQTATNAAPTMTKELVNKKYVDDQIATAPGGLVYDGNQVFGSTPANCPTSFTDLNLSTWVGANRALVYLKVKVTNSSETFYFRTNGETSDVGSGNECAGTTGAQIDTGNIAYFLVLTDSSGKVEWYGTNAKDTDVWLLAHIK